MRKSKSKQSKRKPGVLSSKQQAYRLRFKVEVQTRYGARLCRALLPEEVAEMAHVSLGTVYRWMKGTTPISPAHEELLQYKALGLIPDPQWAGWRVVDGLLYSPHDDDFHSQVLWDLVGTRREHKYGLTEIALLKSQLEQSQFRLEKAEMLLAKSKQELLLDMKKRLVSDIEEMEAIARAERGLVSPAKHQALVS